MADTCWSTDVADAADVADVVDVVDVVDSCILRRIH